MNNVHELFLSQLYISSACGSSTEIEHLTIRGGVRRKRRGKVEGAGGGRRTKGGGRREGGGVREGQRRRKGSRRRKGRRRRQERRGRNKGKGREGEG